MHVVVFCVFIVPFVRRHRLMHAHRTDLDDDTALKILHASFTVLASNVTL